MALEKSEVRLLSVLRSFGEGAGKTELRVVSWNGKDPVLEKRLYVRDRVREIVRPGRCLGLSLSDARYIVSNWPDVERAMLDADNKNMGAH